MEGLYYERLKELVEVKLDRRKRRDVALVAPLGSEKELETLLRHVGSEQDKVDLLLVVREGVKVEEVLPEGLSVAVLEEKKPIGTSGAFFVGTSFAYKEGYSYIIISDYDVEPLQRGTIGQLVSLCKERGKAVVPLSVYKNPDQVSYNINQMGCLPRQVVEKVGVHLPYTWRGGEDWELIKRLERRGLLEVIESLKVRHPREGLTVFEKLSQPKKYIPYLHGLLKAYAFIPPLPSFARMVLWLTYYTPLFILLSRRGLSQLKGFFTLSPTLVVIKPIISAEKEQELPTGKVEKTLLTVKVILGLLLREEVVVSGLRVRRHVSLPTFWGRFLLALLSLPIGPFIGIALWVHLYKEHLSLPLPLPESFAEVVEAFKRLLKL